MALILTQAKQMRYQSLFHSQAHEKDFFKQKHHRIYQAKDAILFIEITTEKAHVYPAFNSLAALKKGLDALNTLLDPGKIVHIQLNVDKAKPEKLQQLIKLFESAGCELMDDNVAYVCESLNQFNGMTFDDIKPYQKRDKEAVYSMATSLLGRSRFNMPFTEFQAFLNASTSVIRLIYDSEKPLGFVFGHIYNQGLSIFIRGLGVLPEYRRQGYARKLMQCLFKDAAALGVSTSMLWVEKENNSAIALYKALGYLPSGDQEVVMTYQLNTCSGSSGDRATAS